MSPYAVALYTSDFFQMGKRFLFALGSNKTECYLKLDDPYSYLLLQQLKKQSWYSATAFRFYIVDQLPGDNAETYAERALYLLKDAFELARYWQLDFPAQCTLPAPQQRHSAEQALLTELESADFIDLAIEQLGKMWRGQLEPSPESQSRDLLEQANQRLEKKGHYNSAMLYRGGEWYWGVDRLEEYCSDWQLPIVMPTASANEPANQDNETAVIECFFSFRSPYSYLGLARLTELAERYQAQIKIRPMLPMVMRGLAVPGDKKRYIVRDTKRQAKRHGVDFGFIKDPLGDGIYHCLDGFLLAREHNLEARYCLHIARAIWSQGRDVGQWSTLENLCQELGLPIAELAAIKGQKRWEQETTENRAELYDNHLWGVPCFRYQDCLVWGQDRLWQIEQALNQQN